ncbi:mitotic deacetylase-associated SANT domain protein [Pristis pectinata]|uniref:mitotic deacetylase-associated SANT domain protein n=1 Tax=Pristis pectinata TaxID=685728 RepID=UPI00223E2716|nr:mitotic deacetylase-associated SANT domain protein [Pristis pectinata]XP_051882590.1 mitotic deacetylase-associated SANT domain protein [Pristis pectinata]XP_051882600.1 mitotic deacetylase-associated SANT domain protein [Pristis pectinata]XP_051882606.1 mitotic deacetylase-associated SANT domain protein [Pristis pectinata]XP_051882615.1 mitotic deacetylase-associated SANT domain protein [Pristis pectinata]XP_051882624.1 mitotic deacetylase-associated SANT domain protein [Pristis pectinata]
MSLQAPGKSSAKRRGKQISFFAESTGATRPSPNRQRKNGMLHGEAKVSEGLVNPQQPPKPTAPVTGVHGHPVVAVDVEMDQENVTKDGTVPPNWAASVLVDRLPAKGGLNWQPAGQGVSWNQSATPFCASSGAVSNVPVPFLNTLAKQGSTTHLSHESLQSQQENKGSGSQLGLFGDAIKQMDEKAHLAKKPAKQPVHSLTELPKPQLQNSLQHQTQQNPVQHQRQHQSLQNQLQHQSLQNQLQHQSQQHQSQHQSQQNQLQHQNQLLHQSQQNSRLQHQQQTTKPHTRLQLPPQQTQLQHQHQQQIRLQQQHQQNQRQYQQTQHQQAQLLHHQEHQQQQTSNETLLHHQFFQFPYGQSQKPDLPPNSVLNMFHQSRQPSLLPLYSHPTQATCQQHLFQQFFPHQQPPQSLGLHRIQTSQGSDPPTHLIVSAPSQLQQQPSDAQIKGIQRSTGGHKQEHPLRQIGTEFQTPLAKQTRCALKERKVQPCPFELQRLGNECGTMESTSQRWPQAYGPELQKLLNMPSNHGAQNQHKLLGADLLQPKNIQAHTQTSENIRSQRGHEKTQVNQNSGKSAQETSSETEEATDSIIQSTRKGGGISHETNGLRPQQLLYDQNLSTEVREDDRREEGKRTLEHSRAAGALAEVAPTGGQLDDSCLVPLVIPVSVPVRNTSQKGDGESQRNPSSARDRSELNSSQSTTRKRRLSRGSGGGPSVQEVEHSRGQLNLTAKLKRRPRPEPLFIPPKPHNHVSVITYPPGTLYQSNLRSPVRLPEHPVDRNFQPPPYTPPPILSPMREGSGLYFNAILSASTNSSQPVTPRSTPKFCLSRSNSADTPPPVLPLMNEATPASIEPRINIGPQFQAEIPELRDKSLAMLDANHADMVFKPWENRKSNQLDQRRMEDLMTVACSSILPGGGTNQELTLHCLHEAKGNVLAALNMLLIKKSPRGKSRALINYHYAGSDQWTSQEKVMFNKGLAAHKKDFFLVQKLVKTKTVAQCVEFYYTYKKQVKIGKNGTLIFGDTSATDSKTVDESSTVDRKDSLRRKVRVPLAADFKNELSEEVKEEVKEDAGKEDDDDEEEEADEDEEEEEEKEEYKPDHKKPILTQTQDVHLRKNNDPTYRCNYRPRQSSVTAVAPRTSSRNERAQLGDSAKLGKQAQENIFPCKKCGKVFYKVKSRSAHMKSHSVQEKKQREVELKRQVPAEDELAKGDEECNDYSFYSQDV